MACPLCKHEIITEEPYEDEICWVARCATHKDKWICVLKRHTATPTPAEENHMRTVMEKLFPGIQLRGPRSIPDHFHLHDK